ncbi:MAG: hypothetical protein WCI75_07640 [candidate division NC10 bacterium]
MPDKPQPASEYRSEYCQAVRATCLYVATKLGDLMDEIVVVGGLVPSLLIHPEELPAGTPEHVGTMDLDVGLTLALLGEGRYRSLTGRLRDAGFTQDLNEDGRPTRQRWRILGTESVTVDFLIPPSSDADQGGTLRDIEADFAAVIAPGLTLAFQDRDRIQLEGRTILGERAARDVWVCGPGAFVVLKALAFDRRGENKDAYDLYYIIRNYGKSIEDVAARLHPLLTDGHARRALAILQRDFLDIDGVGPRRVADFLMRGPDDTIQADAVGFVGRLLERCAEAAR